MPLKKWLNEHILLISVICVTSVTAFLHFNSGRLADLGVPYFQLEARFQDWIAKLGRPAPRDPRIIFLADDAASHELDQLFDDDFEAAPILKKMRRRAWTRDIWAAALQRLAEAGAKVVAFDYMFKGEDEGDEQLRAAVEKYKDLTVLGSQFSNVKAANTSMPTIEPPHRTILGEATDPRVGYINLWPDADGKVRRLKFRLTIEEFAKGVKVTDQARVFESFPAKMARQAGLGYLIPPGTGYHRFRYAFKGETLNESRLLTSFYSIFVPSFWEANYKSGEFFRDKFVLIGPEGMYHKDLVESPFGTISGPEAHLNALNALLTGELLQESSKWLDCLLIFGAGFVAWAFGKLVRNPWFYFLTLPCCGTVLFLIAYLQFNRGFVQPLFGPILALFGSTMTAVTWQQVVEQLERTRLRRMFERYVSRDVVKELVDNPQSTLDTVGGTRKVITVLFSDVRDFTTVTESGDPQALFAQLNEYFNHMVEIVFANRGTFDKFIGDAVMAQWGGIKTEGPRQDAINAVSSALQMRKSLADLNRRWASDGKLEFRIGIGIDHGEAIVGYIGSTERGEITAIGDVVNTASRLEGSTKKYHADLLIGESVKKHLDETFAVRTVALLQPKGKTHPLEVFTIFDRYLPGEPHPGWLSEHEEGVRLFRKSDFASAAERFRAVLKSLPDDWLVQHYLQNCERYLREPPPPEWNAVDIMLSK
jgi:adenylate cyclase